MKKRGLLRNNNNFHCFRNYAVKCDYSNKLVEKNWTSREFRVERHFDCHAQKTCAWVIVTLESLFTANNAQRTLNGPRSYETFKLLNKVPFIYPRVESSIFRHYS